MKFRLRLLDGELLVAARFLEHLSACCDATKGVARRDGFDIGVEQLFRRLEIVRHDCLGELTCAGEPHQRKLTDSLHVATEIVVPIRKAARAGVSWLEGALGFGERVRIGDAHRAQMRVGEDGSIVVADVHGEQVPPSGGKVTQIVKVRVPDTDAAFARARDFGARVHQEPITYETGERSCVVEDLAGHRWELTQSVRDVEPEEWGGLAVAPW